jgi:hypothetical protein
MVGLLKDNFPGELTAPLVAYLAHESCPVSGECFETAGGKVNRTCIAQTQGFTDKELTVETIAARWAEVMDPADAKIVEANAFDSGGWKVRPYSDYAAG